MLVAVAAMAFPTRKKAIIQKSSIFRGTREVNDVRTGAPTVTPSAYNVTVSPAVVTGICKSNEISGNNPTLMNSVVPIAKALIAKASNASVLRFLLSDTSIPPYEMNESFVHLGTIVNK
jgi:hypothetical protein